MNPVQHCHILQALADGQPIACATEAVWGLSCDYNNQQAVQRINQIKQRPSEKPLILVTGDIAHIAFLLSPLSPELREKALSYWPGFTTLLIPDHNNWIPPWIKGDSDSVAVRVTSNAILCAITADWGAPIVSTSANRAGQTPAHSMAEVQANFGNAVYCIESTSDYQLSPSTIIDLVSGKRVR